MFVSTFTLYGGLNHIIFLCLTFFEGGYQILLIRFVPTCRQHVVIERCALLNVTLSDEILLIRFEMLSGNALMILGGWFELSLI